MKNFKEENISKEVPHVEVMGHPPSAKNSFNAMIGLYATNRNSKSNNPKLSTSLQKKLNPDAIPKVQKGNEIKANYLKHERKEDMKKAGMVVAQKENSAMRYYS
mmetsp:Transcript_40433/g.29795  ORF Transcript_40433/g.29795 Transcript_40433/m.29795 type:complete len:104 (+) Transcript_40433:1630-1941(+)